MTTILVGNLLFVFWMHLACRVAAGVVVRIMSATGVALTYERQMLENGFWTAPAGRR